MILLKSGWWRELCVAVLCGVALLSAAPAARGSDADDSGRRLVSCWPATYPELARRMKVTGTVSMEITILPDGTVDSVKVTGGHPLLHTAAEAAVKHWRYSQAKQTTRTNVSVVFNQAP